MIRLACELAWARVRSQFGREVLGALPVALALAGVLMFVPISHLAKELTVRHEVEQLASEERTVTIAISPERRPSASERGSYDRAIRNQLRTPLFNRVIRSTVYRQLAAPNGSTFRLVGTERLRKSATLTGGRWPASCVPERCEVVALANSSPLAPKYAANHPNVIIVGNVTPAADFPFVGELAQGPDEIMLLADGADAVREMKPFTAIRRTDAWSAFVDPSAVTYSNVDQILARTAKIRTEIDSAGVSIRLPEEAVTESLARANRSTRSFLTPAVQLLVLLVAAAVLSGLMPQRTHLRAVDRLQRRGASPRVQIVYRWAYSAILVLLAAILSVPIVLLLTVVLSSGLDASIASSARSLLSTTAVVSFGLALIVLTLLLAVILSDRADRPVLRIGRLRVSDGFVGLMVVVMSVVATRSAASNGDLSAGSEDQTAWLWPALFGVIVTWLVLRFGSLRLRANSAGSQKVSISNLLRRGGGTRERVSIGATVLLVLTAATATFALGASETLRTNVRDQAAWESPLDVRMSTGSTLVRPLELRRTPQWKKLASRVVFTDVIRRSGDLLADTGDGTIEMLGVDPSVIGQARYWRGGDGMSAADVAKVLRSDPLPKIGASLSTTAKSLELVIAGDVGRLAFAAVLERANGTWHELTLTAESKSRFVTTLEPGDAGGRFVGVRIGIGRHDAERTEHHIGEAGTFVAPDQIDLMLQSVSESNGSTSRALQVDLSALESSQARLRSGKDGLEIRGAIEGQSVLVMPAQSGGPIPAVVDRQTAAVAGGIGSEFVVDVLGRRSTFKVAGIAGGFPSLEGRFLVAPRAYVAREFDYAQPGTGVAAEMWVGHRQGVTAGTRAATLTALSRAPFDQVERRDRLAIEDELRGDPIRRISAQLLLGASFLGALVAIAAIVRSVRFAIDDAGGFRRSLVAHGERDRIAIAAIAAEQRGRFLYTIPVGAFVGALTLWLIGDAVGVGAARVVSTSIQPIRVLFGVWMIALFAVLLAVLIAGAAAFGSRTARAVQVSELLRDPVNS